MVNSNGDHILIWSFWLKQPFNNETFMIKWVSIHYWINKFRQCTWFGTLFSTGNFTIHFKICIFQGGSIFWHFLWVIFLCWNFSESDPNKICSIDAVIMIFLYGNFKWLGIVITQQNLYTWCSDTMIVFLGVSKIWASSSTEIFKINIFIVYIIYTVSC